MNTTNSVQAPFTDLPQLPDWAEPRFPDLTTPSLTAAALAKAHAALADNVDTRTRRVHDHAADLAAFAAAVRGVDADHARAFRGY
ncbi:hypothetical protein [Corynebacterium urinipleomorphum]|uniref:hypothetical protein n=1 Tax=Corynebacterium urinipleomorphum TaxID=1852380 RepID=UPI000B359453|nr:hypothetical protein [Corynebacterium urinipleomorphum]